MEEWNYELDRSFCSSLVALILLLLTYKQHFQNFIFSLFLLFVFCYFLFKQLFCLQEVFILVACPWCLKRGFHLEIFFFFFNTIGLPQEVFNPTVGLRCLMEVFTWVSLLFFLFLCLGTWWGRSWDFIHHHDYIFDAIDEFLLWQGLLVGL